MSSVQHVANIPGALIWTSNIQSRRVRDTRTFASTSTLVNTPPPYRRGTTLLQVQFVLEFEQALEFLSLAGKTLAPERHDISSSQAGMRSDVVRGDLT